MVYTKRSFSQGSLLESLSTFCRNCVVFHCFVIFALTWRYELWILELHRPFYAPQNNILYRAIVLAPLDKVVIQCLVHWGGFTNESIKTKS